MVHKCYAEKVSADDKKSLLNSDSKKKKNQGRVQLFHPGLIVTHILQTESSFLSMSRRHPRRQRADQHTLVTGAR